MLDATVPEIPVSYVIFSALGYLALAPLLLLALDGVRCGPIWLTFAAAHLVADRRGNPADWQSLAWLRGTEIATDALWASSPAVSRPGAKLGLRLAGVANIAMAAGFAWMARR